MGGYVNYRRLGADEVGVLRGQGNSAADWGRVLVAEGFCVERVLNSRFGGDVRIGAMGGDVVGAHGLAKAAGIYDATIVDCVIGSNVRIANVGVHISGYDIGDGVCIEDVGTMQTGEGATFGNGTEVEVLNEGGGREVIIFDELSVQFAYLMCLHRYRGELVKKLAGMARGYVATVRADRGTIGAGSMICSVGRMVDVKVGAYATVDGAGSLVNGTILSAADSPTVVGTGVIAEDFIIGEGSSVTEGALLSKTFVGQGCRIGKQFSAEGCLFFANCEGFHGEACSVFCGALYGDASQVDAIDCGFV